MKIILLSALVFIVFIILDLLWFKIMGNFLKNEIASIARLTENREWNVRIFPAMLVYVCMTAAIFVFITPIASSTANAFLLGALFGLISYGIYDFTNLATLSAWTVRFAMVDIAWGTFLCGAVSSLAYTLSRIPFFV